MPWCLYGAMTLIVFIAKPRHFDMELSGAHLASIELFCGPLETGKGVGGAAIELAADHHAQESAPPIVGRVEVAVIVDAILAAVEPEAIQFLAHHHAERQVNLQSENERVPL